ncbi:MAG: carboxylating nicotinate-nucleotide diphosphorylase [Dehalococcoidales bacterium]|nr:carboxylating nicotinate-nucleotide diphosphorylase [Dehalococcoidales bacterium]
MKIISLPLEYVDRLVEQALAEDVPNGDVTSEILIPPELTGRANILVKTPGILAGIPVAKQVFRKSDRSLLVDSRIEDGATVRNGDTVMFIKGNVRAILKAERVALNFLQRLSGIATTTSLYVEKVRGLKVDIADTRKTTPTLRLLEKYAVSAGGGRNHRMDLSDAILIKDNHIAALRVTGRSIREIIAMAKAGAPQGLKVEAEAKTVEEAVEAAEAGADIIMLDNMTVVEMKKAVGLIAGRTEIEASGGINLDTVRSVAETGVDFISVGALTHSYNSLDISLELEY